MPQLLRDETPTPEVSEDEKLAALKRVHEIYSSVGITSIFERALNADGWKTYETLKARGDLNVRTTATIRQQFRTGEQVAEFSQKLGMKTGDGDDWLRVGPLKITVDGGIHWGTARLREPFGPKRIDYKIGTLVEPDYRGSMSYSVEQMRDIFDAGHRQGWQMCVHVAGDAGADAVLDGLEAVNESSRLPTDGFTDARLLPAKTRSNGAAGWASASTRRRFCISVMLGSSIGSTGRAGASDSSGWPTGITAAFRSRSTAIT